MNRLVLLAALASLAPASLAQVQTNVPIHQHSATDVIDGSQHPDQIPDIAAYRMVLLSLSKPANRTELQATHQNVQLRSAGLNDSEKSVLIPILAKFNSDYHALIQSYNAAATAANARGERADIGSFLIKRDQLVQATHDQIKGIFTADRWTQFDAYVQQEKKHMKIGRGEVSKY
ncbi:MAG TPA: hypothetical protein VN734_10675 [Acidobacteriaceae bacterium]|nr:hypothetical protein [Acidobacteriaceae bacterium]